MVKNKKGAQEPHVHELAPTPHTLGTKLQQTNENSNALLDFSRANDAKIEGLINVDEARAIDELEAMLATLERGKGGNIICNRPNLVTMLGFILGDAIYYDLLADAIMIKGGLEWNTAPAPRPWQDADDAALKFLLQNTPYALPTISGQIFDDALLIVARDHSTHPIREYLGGLQWDGMPRLDNALVHYLGATDTAFTRAVTRKTFVACCKRVFEPGCQADYSLLLTGPEGIGKSRFWAIMGGPWYTSSMPNMDGGKQAMEALRGVWIVELGDLSGLTKADAENAKAFISRQSDDYRPAYGHRVTHFPRQCVFVATTNRDAFLRSQHGNRRFWIVPTGQSSRPFDSGADMQAALTATRDQLWAEAMRLYRDGEPIYLSDDLEREARQIQRDYNVAQLDPLKLEIDAFLAVLLPHDWAGYDKGQRRQYIQAHKHGTAYAVDGVAQRASIIYEEFANEWLDITPMARDRQENKKAFNAIMRLYAEWKLSNPKPYRPYIAKNRQARVFELIGIDANDAQAQN